MTYGTDTYGNLSIIFFSLSPPESLTTPSQALTIPFEALTITSEVLTTPSEAVTTPSEALPHPLRSSHTLPGSHYPI